MSKILSISSILSEQQRTKIKEVFKTMTCEETAESIGLAQDWLPDNETLVGCFVNGKRLSVSSQKCFLYYNKNKLCSLGTVDQSIVENTLTSASSAFSVWTNLSGHERAKCLYNISKNIQKQQSLLAVLECMGASKFPYSTNNHDIPNLIQSFYHFAGWAALWESEMSDMEPLGIISLISNPTNGLLMSVGSQICAALASGNCVMLLPSASSCLSSLLLAEIFQLSGLPPGVFNVLPFQNDQQCMQLLHSLCFSKTENAEKDSTPDLKIVSNYEFPYFWEKLMHKNLDTRLLNVEFDLCHSFQPSIIVLKDADLHSAVNSILECFYSQGETHDSLCHVLVQDAVKQHLIDKLQMKFSGLNIGCSLSRAEMISTDFNIPLEDEENGAMIMKLDCTASNSCNTIIAIRENETLSKLENPERKIKSKALSIVSFRTEKEAIEMFNHRKTGRNACIWTEKLSVALEIAHKLKSGTIWVNCQNKFDASAGYGGPYLSMSLRKGGKFSLMPFIKPADATPCEAAVKKVENLDEYGKALHKDKSTGDICSNSDFSNQTFKLFYGGTYKSADGNKLTAVLNFSGETVGFVSEGSMNNLYSAIESAKTAQMKWIKETAFQRCQLLYALAEKLEAQKDAFFSLLKHQKSPVTFEALVLEVELSIQRIFYWAAYCDKYGGLIQETQMYGKVLETNEPLGVIGIICPDEYPLLAFISLLCPAIARGNTVVVIPSENYPIPALKLCDLFRISGIPAGVVNVISGHSDALIRHMAVHTGIDTVWLHRNTTIGHAYLQVKAVKINKKSLWVGYERDWFNSKLGQGLEFIHRATYNKTIWLPMGNILP